MQADPQLFASPDDVGRPVAAHAYDALGVPMTVAAALAMTRSEVELAVQGVVAELDGVDVTDFLHTAPRTVSGSIPLDSPQAVFAIARFNRAFGKQKLIKLSKITEADWSSLDVLTDLIVRSIDARRK